MKFHIRGDGLVQETADSFAKISAGNVATDVPIDSIAITCGVTCKEEIDLL